MLARASIGMAAGLLLAAWPAATQQPGPLASVEPGAWTLTGANGAAIGTLCLGDPLLLGQPQRGGQACTRQIIESDAHSVAVGYSCPGTGRGRTVLRIETPRLVQIDSQGVQNGTPFALRATARRTGPC